MRQPRRPPLHKLRVAPEIFARFPGCRVLVVYAGNLRNRPSDDASRRLLRRAEAAARAAFGDTRPSAHPHVAAWRDAYSAFGSKPSRFPSSVEALLKRVLRGEPLPEINALVDIYNAASVRHVLPIGGEDRERLAGELVLTLARGGEPFLTRGEDDEQVAAGEVVWCDAAGVTCRRWNWRQGLRTALTLATRHAYFVLESLPPYPAAQLTAAGEELAADIAAQSPGCKIAIEILAAAGGTGEPARPAGH
jgi:DNA/RNA-binding domain of Phe-tRNA-synthetase-like protein